MLMTFLLYFYTVEAAGIASYLSRIQCIVLTILYSIILECSRFLPSRVRVFSHYFECSSAPRQIPEFQEDFEGLGLALEIMVLLDFYK